MGFLRSALIYAGLQAAMMPAAHSQVHIDNVDSEVVNLPLFSITGNFESAYLGDSPLRKPIEIKNTPELSELVPNVPFYMEPPSNSQIARDAIEGFANTFGYNPSQFEKRINRLAQRMEFESRNFGSFDDVGLDVFGLELSKKFPDHGVTLVAGRKRFDLYFLGKKDGINGRFSYNTGGKENDWSNPRYLPVNKFEIVIGGDWSKIPRLLRRR